MSVWQKAHEKKFWFYFFVIFGFSTLEIKYVPYVRTYISGFIILKIMFYDTWTLKNIHWRFFEQFSAVFRIHRKWQGHHIKKIDFFFMKKTVILMAYFEQKQHEKLFFSTLFFINMLIMCHLWWKHDKWDNKWLCGHEAHIFWNLNEDFHKIIKNTLLSDMCHMSCNHIIVSTTL